MTSFTAQRRPDQLRPVNSITPRGLAQSTLTLSEVELERLETELRELRGQILREQPKQLAARSWLTDAVPRVSIQICGLLLTISAGPGTLLIGPILMALGTVMLMASWFHDQVHIKPQSRLLYGRVLMRLGSAPVGASPAWWAYKHVRLHHTYPGNPRYDPDIQFGWLGRVSVDQEWRWTHRTQHVHMWPLMMFATLSMLKPGEIFQYRRFREATGITPQHTLAACLLDKYVPYIAFWVPILAIRGVVAGAIAMLTFHLVAGVLVSVITQVQHNTMLTLTDDPRIQNHWILSQLHTASDVGTERNWWWWLCGGVSFHAVHHMVPAVSFLELPGATSRVAEVLANHGLSLRRHQSIFSALVSHGRLLRTLSTSPRTLVHQ